MVEYHGDGFEHYFDIEPDGTVFYVLDVEDDFFFGAEIVASVDLSETGQARLDLKALAEAVDVLLKGVVEDLALGARTDERELAGYASPELRQLVKACLAEEVPNLVIRLSLSPSDHCAPDFSASATILLNLTRLNFFPLRPRRSCL